MIRVPRARRVRREIVYADETVVAFLCEPPATWGMCSSFRVGAEIPGDEASSAVRTAQVIAEVTISQNEHPAGDAEVSSGTSRFRPTFTPVRSRPTSRRAPRCMRSRRRRDGLDGGRSGRAR